jgi:uroporphyrinogen-III decarboxylase
VEVNWEKLSPEERLEGVNFVNLETKNKYKEKIFRVKKALQLKVPDRVPFIPLYGLFPAHFAGFTVNEVMYDYNKAHQAWKKTILTLDPDLFVNISIAYSARAFELIGYKQLRVPGKQLPDPRQTYQFVENEYMRSDEYSEFITDPTDFMIRRYYPRAFSELEPFQDLLPLRTGMWTCWFDLFKPFGNPQIINALNSLIKTGQEIGKWYEAIDKFNKELQELGYPNMIGTLTFAPFDLIGDSLRGTRGIMLDMLRMPDKLHAALEKITPFAIEIGIRGSRVARNPIVLIPLHKGSSGFMSGQQFKTFYWPTLKELILNLIDAGLIPYVYTEGDYTPRLEYLTDVPMGKVLYHFESVDINKAKQLLGNVACFVGNVPLSILQTGTPEQVRDYVKNLIDVVGKDGGLMVDAAAGFDNVPEINVLAMRDATREYGIY